MMKRKRPTSILGIELTRDRLTAVELRLRGGRVSTEQSTSAPLALDVFTTEPELSGREIRSHLDAAGIRARACVLCLPLDSLLIHTVDLAGVPEADVESLLSLEAERAFPFSPEDLALAVSRFEDSGGKARALLAALPANHLEPLAKALRRAGLRLAGCTAGPAALLDRDGRERDAIVFADRHSLQLALSVNSGIALLRSFPLPDPSAINAGGGDAREEEFGDLRRDLRLTLRRIPGDLRASLKHIRIFEREQMPGKMREIVEGELAEAGLVPVAAGVSGGGEVMQGLTGTPFPAVTRSAAAYLTGHGAALEFWRAREARWRAALRRLLARGALVRVGLAAGLIALCVLAAVAWQVWRVGSLERRWSEIRPDVQKLQSLQEGIRVRRPWLADEPERLGLLRALASAFPETGSVWVRSVEIRQTDRVECLGFARSNRDYLGVLESLRATPGVRDLQVVQVKGGSPIQFSFQYLWKKEAGE